MNHYRFQFNIVTYKTKDNKYYAYCSDYLPRIGKRDLERLPSIEGTSIEDARDKMGKLITKHIELTEEMIVWPMTGLSIEEDD